MAGCLSLFDGYVSSDVDILTPMSLSDVTSLIDLVLGVNVQVYQWNVFCIH